MHGITSNYSRPFPNSSKKAGTFAGTTVTLTLKPHGPPPPPPPKPDLNPAKTLIPTPKTPKNLKSKSQLLTAAAKIPQKSAVQKPDPKQQLFLDLTENYISSTTKTVFFALKKNLGLQKYTFG
jgi:hypothetical protein